MPIKHLVPDLLTSDQVWSDLIDTLDKVVSVPVEGRIQEMRHRLNLEYFSNISEGLSDESGNKGLYVPQVKDLTDETFMMLKYMADAVGYDYPGLEKADANAHMRLIDGSVRFISEKGSKSYSDFLSYVLDKNIRVVPLWYDYTDEAFYEHSDAALDTKRFDATTGSHTAFPTAYIDVELDAELVKTWSYSKLLQLIYSVAPATTVIRDAYFGFGAPDISINLYSAHVGPVVETETFADAPSIMFEVKPSIANPTDVSFMWDMEHCQMFTDVAGTTAASYGQAVARVNAVIGSAYLQQATVDKRPFKGVEPFAGIRNLLDRSDDFENPFWTKVNLVATDLDDDSTVADPLPELPFAFKIHKLVPTTTNGLHTITASARTVGAGVWAVTVFLKADEYDEAYVDFNGGRAIVDLTTGTVVNSGFNTATLTLVEVGLEGVPDAWYRLEITDTLASTTVLPMASIGVMLTGLDTFIGDGTSGILVAGAMFEATAYSLYQKRISQYEVYQRGDRGRHYLSFDSDALLTTASAVNFSGATGLSLFACVRKDTNTAGCIFTSEGTGGFQVWAPEPDGTPTGSGVTFLGATGNMPSYFTTPPIGMVALSACADYTRGKTVALSNTENLWAQNATLGGTLTNRVLSVGAYTSDTNHFVGKIYLVGFVAKFVGANKIKSFHDWMLTRYMS